MAEATPLSILLVPAGKTKPDALGNGPSCPVSPSGEARLLERQWTVANMAKALLAKFSLFPLLRELGRAWQFLTSARVTLPSDVSGVLLESNQFNPERGFLCFSGWGEEPGFRSFLIPAFLPDVAGGEQGCGSSSSTSGM